MNKKRGCLDDHSRFNPHRMGGSPNNSETKKLNRVASNLLVSYKYLIIFALFSMKNNLNLALNHLTNSR